MSVGLEVAHNEQSRCKDKKRKENVLPSTIQICNYVSILHEKVLFHQIMIFFSW